MWFLSPVKLHNYCCGSTCFQQKVGSAHKWSHTVKIKDIHPSQSWSVPSSFLCPSFCICCLMSKSGKVWNLIKPTIHEELLLNRGGATESCKNSSLSQLRLHLYACLSQLQRTGKCLGNQGKDLAGRSAVYQEELKFLSQLKSTLFLLDWHYL